MITTKIAGAAAALALLAAPATALAHGGGHGPKGPHHRHHAKPPKPRTITATATVTSFAGGTLTLTTTSGKAVTGAVSDKTIVKCWTAAPQAPAAGTARRANGRCGTDQLVAGAKIAYAKLSLIDGDATWKKVVLVQ